MAKLGGSWTFGEQSDQIKLRRQYLFFHALYLHTYFKNRAAGIPAAQTSINWVQNVNVFGIKTRFEKNVGPDLDPSCLQKLLAGGKRRKREIYIQREGGEVMHPELNSATKCYIVSITCRYELPTQSIKK